MAAAHAQVRPSPLAKSEYLTFVGKHIADTSLFLVVSNVLATFMISKAKDPSTGLEIEPEVKWTTGITS